MSPIIYTYYDLPYKIAWTEITGNIRIDTSWSLKEFINVMTSYIHHKYDFTDFKLVETCQIEKGNCVGEKGVPFSPSNLTIAEMFHKKIQNNSLMFYIRKEPVIPVDELRCSVCLNNRKNVLFSPCNHICCCQTCFDMSTNINECFICRQHINSHQIVYL